MNILNHLKQSILVYKNSQPNIDIEGYIVAPTLAEPFEVYMAVEVVEDRVEDDVRGLVIRTSTVLWSDDDTQLLDKQDIVSIRDKTYTVVGVLYSEQAKIYRYEVKEYGDS